MTLALTWDFCHWWNHQYSYIKLQLQQMAGRTVCDVLTLKLDITACYLMHLLKEHIYYNTTIVGF